MPKLVRCFGGLAPVGKDRVGLLLKGDELGVAKDGRLHLGEGRLEACVAGATSFFVKGLKQHAAHSGEHLPVGAERVDVTLRDTTAQVPVDVLQILGLGTVYVARQVEVVVVLESAISAKGTMRA